MNSNPKCHFCFETDLQTVSTTYACKLVCGNNNLKTMVREVEGVLQSPFTSWCNHCFSVYICSSWCEQNDCTLANPVKAEGLIATLAFYKMMSMNNDKKISL